MTETVDNSGELQSTLVEDRIFDPPKDIDARLSGAYVSSIDEYRSLHERSVTDPEGFWSEIGDGA